HDGSSDRDSLRPGHCNTPAALHCINVMRTSRIARERRGVSRMYGRKRARSRHPRVCGDPVLTQRQVARLPCRDAKTNGMVAPFPIRHRGARVEIVRRPLTREEATAMKITTIGVDLAKNVFQVHGVDARGKAGLKKQLKRAQVLPFFANLAPGLIGMEACAGAHYWARKLEGLGHTVKLMPPQYVKP